jgi:hypothetical protein
MTEGGTLGIEQLNLFAMLRIRLQVIEPPLEEDEDDAYAVISPPGVWATSSCVCEVYTGTKEAMTSKRFLLYGLTGDVSKGEDVEWKITLLHSH